MEMLNVLILVKLFFWVGLAEAFILAYGLGRSSIEISPRQEFLLNRRCDDFSFG